MSEREFSIKDNCGGISLSDAIDYAFHFGRRPGARSDVKGGIGLYGIGMKRAIFKIGRSAKIVSHSERDSFEVSVDVEAWRHRDDWDFEYVGVERGAERGTSIRIAQLNRGIGAILGDPSFANTLLKAISRDYSFLIDQGLAIQVGSIVAPSNKYLLEDEAAIAPAVELYEDEGVGVKIFAGLIGSLPDDVPEELHPEAVERYG